MANIVNKSILKCAIIDDAALQKLTIVRLIKKTSFFI